MREIIRRIQQLRKEANLTKQDVVEIAFSGSLKEIITNKSKEITKIVGASSIDIVEEDKHHLDIKKEEQVKGKKFVISLRKVE